MLLRPQNEGCGFESHPGTVFYSTAAYAREPFATLSLCNRRVDQIGIKLPISDPFSELNPFAFTLSEMIPIAFLLEPVLGHTPVHPTPKGVGSLGLQPGLHPPLVPARERGPGLAHRASGGLPGERMPP